MNRYTLQTDGRVLDNATRTMVEPEDFWYQDMSTGDIVTLSQLLMHSEETEGHPGYILTDKGLFLRNENTSYPVAMRYPIALPVRETFVPPINTSYLTLTDKDGREAAAYRANGRWVDVMFGSVSHRINFLTPGDRRCLTIAELEGNGDDAKLDKLKTFMRAIVAASNIWED